MTYPTTSPPRDCSTCGAALSEEVRSRPALNQRHHTEQECIAALRDRILALEKRLGPVTP